MSRSRPDIEIHRVYEAEVPIDRGRRVLIDRLWPRGVSKQDADWDEWLKDAAPSTDLRRWYGHDVDRFAEFSRRYRSELRDGSASAAVDHLLAAASDGGLVLLTATRDVEHSGAQVLYDVLTGQPQAPA